MHIRQSFYVTLFEWQIAGVGNLLPTLIYLLWDTESGQRGLSPSTKVGSGFLPLCI